MSDNDPLELFDRLDPTRVVTDGSNDEAILTAIVGKESPPDQRRSRRWWVGGGTVAVVALATAAFTVLRSQPVDDPTGVTCMATRDPGGDRVGIPPSDEPIEACAALWSDGTLGSEPPPALAACVNDVGAAVVFPSGGDICSRLGLAELEPGFSESQQRIVELQDTLAELFLDTCFFEAEAVEESRRQLEAAGLSEWVVEVPEPFDEQLCAGPGLDIEAQRVVLAGVREP